MEAVIDQACLIVVPKPIRDALGLLPGTKVDITPYGAGAYKLCPQAGRRAWSRKTACSWRPYTPVDDDVVFALIDAGRK